MASCEGKIVEPLNETERMLRSLWGTVLQVPEATISATASFIKLGGDSITAIRLASAARQSGLELTVAEILLHPRLNNMAALARPLATALPRAPSAHGSAPVTLPPRWTSSSVWLKSDNVESIALATESQAWLLAVGELDGQGFQNTYRIRATSGLDRDRLFKACKEVLQHQAILRTVFVAVGAELLQVVLRQVPGDRVHFDDTDLYEDVAFRPGRLLPRFHISPGSIPGSFQLEIHIHHALYDAFSMDMILRDISAAYSGQELIQAPNFHTWVEHERELNTAAARTYWRETLQGSSMTYLTRPNIPSMGGAAESYVEFHVPARVLLHESGTPASVFKAAWATILSQALDTSDVVFGEIQAIRTSNFQDVDAVCGPSTNVVPIRTILKDDDQRGGLNVSCSALIAQIQAQSFSSIPHRHVGIRSLIRDCTDWPPWTRFSSITIFQNHRALQEARTIGDVECELEQISFNGDSADVWVIAMPSADRVDIRIMYAPERISPVQAQWLSRSMKAALEAFAELETTVQELRGRLRELGPYEIPQLSPTRLPSPGLPSTTVSRQSWNVVQQAWQETKLLTDDVQESSTESSLSSSHASATEAYYLQSRGDLVTAMLLSEWYYSHGVEMSVVNIVSHPSRLQQAGYIDFIESRGETNTSEHSG